MPKLRIGLLLFPRMTQLDLTGPFEVFTRLPDAQVLTLATMCGHGMVSASLAKKMIDWVKEGRRTPEQAAMYMAHFCSCGAYNPSRAKRLLEESRHNTK